MGVKGSVAEVKVAEQSPIKRVVECWNAVVSALQVAEVQWNEMQALLLEIPRADVQLAPIEVQQAAAKFRRAKFTVMLERFVSHYRAYGGLEAMKVKERRGESNASH